MTMNFFRTILGVLAGILPMVSVFLGCTTEATGDLSCETSWLPPQYAALSTTLLIGLNLLLKAFQGGTPGAGLVAKTVVVSSTGAPGTVTKAQVEEHAKK